LPNVRARWRLSTAWRNLGKPPGSRNPVHGAGRRHRDFGIVIGRRIWFTCRPPPARSRRSGRRAGRARGLDPGVPLRDVQEAPSHANPRTTMRHDRARTSPDRHATYIVAAFIAGGSQIIHPAPTHLFGRFQRPNRSSTPAHLQRSLTVTSTPTANRRRRGIGSPGGHLVRRARRGDLQLSARGLGHAVGAWATGRP
jgi:hypothetical protein